MARDIPHPHPGDVLKEEFLISMGLSVYALAKAIHAPRSRLNDIRHGRQAITPAMALRLGRFFQVDPHWFVNMQSVYDLAQAWDGLGEALDAIEPWRRPEAA